MRTTHKLAVLGLAAAGCLASIHESDAARIYNSLQFDVQVEGYDAVVIPTNTITIQAGQRSDSLSWTGTVGLKITNTSLYHTGTVTGNGQGAGGIDPTPVYYNLCGTTYFKFSGLHAQIQGGNYMVIGQRGTKINCTVCDAGHNVLDSASTDLSTLAGAYQPPKSYLQPYNSQYYGC